MRKWNGWWIALSLLGGCLLFGPSALAGKRDEARAVWITRWACKTPEDIQRMAANASQFNFNMLLFQVRGNATVFYQSDLEPWAWELTGGDPSTLGTDPGWDPLQVACAAAHAQGLQLHVWMNVFPGWKQPTPPPEGANHLWNTHRDWFMQNRAGEIMWPQGWWDYWYTFLDPGVPEVKKHLRDVFLEVAKKYPVDGLNYDYVRYPYEVGDWAYNATCVARFRESYHAEPEALPVQWSEWKRQQITDIVHDIYRDATKLRPGLVVSGAVIGEWPRGYNDYSQDSRTWLSRGTIDIILPMLYNKSPEDFQYYMRDFLENAHGRWVLPGLGVGRASAEDLLQLIEISRKLGAPGVAIYDYSALFPDHKPNEKALALKAGPFARKAAAPKMGWKED